MAPTKVRTSATLVRSPSARSASARPCPICISRSTRESSSASGPSVLRATCWSAASKPRPDSTLMVSRSIASGSSRCSSLGRARRPSGRGTGSVRRSRATVPPSTTMQADRGSSCRASAENTRPRQQAGHGADHLAGRAPGRRSSPAGCRPGRACAGSARRVSAPEIRRPISRARCLQRLEDPLGERLLELLGELLGRVGHRLEHRQRAGDAARVLAAEGRSRDEDDRQTSTRRTPRTKSMAISDLHLDQSAHPEDPQAGWWRRRPASPAQRLGEHARMT